jgi:hypothetical protein
MDKNIDLLIRKRQWKPNFWDENDVFFAVPEPFNQILVLSVEQGTLTRHNCLGTLKILLKQV